MLTPEGTTKKTSLKSNKPIKFQSTFHHARRTCFMTRGKLGDNARTEK
jgi:hypothetical protein